MKLSENIRYFRRKNGLSQNDLATALGYKSFTTIQKWETGVAEPNLDKIDKMARIFNISMDELIGQKKKPLDIPFSFMYDYAPVSISAGGLNFVEPLEKFEKLEVPNVILGKYAKDKEILFMHVNGESMNKILADGSLIAVKRNVNYNNIKDNDIVVVATDEGYTVKRYYNDKENQRIILRPDSNDFTFMPIIKSYDDDIRLVGKVVMYNVLL